MKLWLIIASTILFLATPFYPAVAEDMRAVTLATRQTQDNVLKKVENERKQAEQEAEKSRQHILADKTALTAEINRLKSANQSLKQTHKQLEKTDSQLMVKEKQALSQLNEAAAMVKELTGFIQTTAKDLNTLLDQSHQAAFDPGRSRILKPILADSAFPGMDDIRQMTDLLFDEIRRSGEVRIQQGPIVERSGHETTADILTLGNFTAAYRLEKETGFLIYSDKSNRFFALSKLPAARIQKNINHYMNGTTEDVFMDISRGAALRQLTHQLNLVDQIWKGGPIVWPILAIAVIAFLIILERFWVLGRMDINADVLMGKIKSLISAGKWSEIPELCATVEKKPVPRVLLAGFECRHMARPDMENVLQETILREISHLERFMSTLGMLATVSPLLGLLGTVTGMINTFHVITYYGTGDPRMMSGGISEALVTTMLGLAVAIPIMLCHTILARKTEKIIGQMEEKAVSLTNVIFKTGHAA
ncbi:MAG: DUF3450 family protein [Desulfobacterales bacterium]|nr:DUF3450 family protein [Desulfobacterales bacterium]MDD4073202.1 DUF3450 family protein [Desulfobacterales bacterium]MDD4393977.1 DUF3450 family protein [Desulfobacterales bacterium]